MLAPISSVIAMLLDESRWPLFSRVLGATLEETAFGYIWARAPGSSLSRA